ncbi:Sterol uptake control 2 [Hyphodiscus hymeniophilus]|uniref:Sterol uptake control 2 n=1 Tax=Hyphodiscus hymeniophilus TaxID=353542 RepID=A0A9P7B069_9HELO|nr:Sterol uptake control 2 [Hyphodiscus hymeniophilus]
MSELFINIVISEPDVVVLSQVENPKSYKRPYKKSISGCKACKTRKVKCDEQRPVCANCKKRYINVTCCEYALHSSKSSKKWSTSSRSSISSHPTETLRLEKQVSLKPSGLNESNRILELRLLHHYTKTTCGADSLEDMVPIISHSMWEISIPQLAFSSPVVLDALLGISALHLLALQPGDQSLAVVSRTYFDKAIKGQRDSLCSLSVENAEPLLVGAVLIAHHTWLAQHLIESPHEHYGMSLQTYQMCVGIQTLIRDTTPWLEKYNFRPEETESGLDDDVRSNGFVKLALDDMTLLSAHFYDNVVPPTDSDAYRVTSDELIKIYCLVVAQTCEVTRIEQEIVTVLHRLPARFLELLRAEEPLAMALMARNLCLLTFFEDTSKAWWVHGAGEKKVATTAVLAIRKSMPLEWLWTMAWPMNVVSREIKLDLSNY